MENNNVVVNSAKAIGCSVVNIGSQDLGEGREHLILGLIWQIIKIGLQSNIDIKVHPELFRLLEPGETLEQLLKLPPDQILLRWFNYHLKKAGWTRKVANFGSDIKVIESCSCNPSRILTGGLGWRKLHCTFESAQARCVLSSSTTNQGTLRAR
jgi:plastin-1